MNTIIEYAHNYQIDREKVMRTLLSCKTIPQVEHAENFFLALKNKWLNVISTNSTIKVLFDIDEHKFYREYHSMVAQFRCV